MSDQILVNGELTSNPNTNWNQVNPNFPDQPIQAFVPDTKHGTREVFEDKVILEGCEATGAFDVFKAANEGDKKTAEKACIALREDGTAVDIDDDYTETLARIESNKDGIGVFGLAFFENNTDTLQVATMSDVVPSTESISSGDYPVSRPLFFYMKKAHIGVTHSSKDFAELFLVNEIAGEDGPLADYGLVANPELEATQTVISEETIIGSGS